MWRAIASDDHWQIHHDDYGPLLDDRDGVARFDWMGSAEAIAERMNEQAAEREDPRQPRVGIRYCGPMRRSS